MKRGKWEIGRRLGSMKITQDVREYAAQKELDEQAALRSSLSAASFFCVTRSQ
ncbi:MAG: hypothetical protein H0U54_07420 [Acidobacteria bacterium]|nr:hypothetical protein [Acidobacteriota bacterium]